MKPILSRLLVLSASVAACVFASVLPGVVVAQQPTAVERPKDLPEDAKILLNLPYVENGHAQQKLDLYLPAQPKGPLLVWIHGGGWVGGTKDRPPGLAMVKNGV